MWSCPLMSLSPPQSLNACLHLEHRWLPRGSWQHSSTEGSSRGDTERETGGHRGGQNRETGGKPWWARCRGWQGSHRCRGWQGSHRCRGWQGLQRCRGWQGSHRCRPGDVRYLLCWGECALTPSSRPWGRQPRGLRAGAITCFILGIPIQACYHRPISSRWCAQLHMKQQHRAGSPGTAHAE